MMSVNKKVTACVAVCVVLLLPVFGIFATEPKELFDKIDENYIESEYEANRSLLEDLEGLVSSEVERAGYLWRLSRNTLFLADAAERAGASDDHLLEEYKRGEELADEAVELDPRNPHAYYWRASNVGRWGQTKGILNSLMKAKPMREDLERAVNLENDHSDSYYVLGLLYASVPKLVSFGNKDYAVSYSRKALDSYVGLKTKYSYYLKLAEQLWDRDWSARKRRREFDKLEKEYRRAETATEKNKYFEGIFDASASRIYARSGLEELSDQEEAKKIISWLIDAMERAGSLSEPDRALLEEVREFWEEWS